MRQLRLYVWCEHRAVRVVQHVTHGEKRARICIRLGEGRGDLHRELAIAEQRSSRAHTKHDRAGGKHEGVARPPPPRINDGVQKCPRRTATLPLTAKLGQASVNYGRDPRFETDRYTDVDEVIRGAPHPPVR